MEKKFAYVELMFFKNATKQFKKIVKDVVSKEQFYYSDQISRISGDVTDKIHFTLFYGLDESVMNNKELKKLLKKIEVKKLDLSKLVLFEGYQGMYKVLCVEVNDEDKTLYNLSEKMLDFEHDEELGKREFKAHITLAYVQPDYVLPKQYALDKKPVRVKKILLKI